jgi:hypothetical protein
MTTREKANQELIKKLTRVYEQWTKKYGIPYDDVFYSDGEYDPNLLEVLKNITVLADEDYEEI